jgi:hypothetical protein
MYALEGLAVVDYVKRASSLTYATRQNSRFSSLEIGIGEGRAVLELQQLVPEANVVGINKPMPEYRWRTSVAQSTDDLRGSAALYGIDFNASQRFPEVILSNATDLVLMGRPPSSSRLIISQHVYHYFTAHERSVLFEQIRRILDDDDGLSYIAWPAAGTLCEHVLGALELGEGQAAMLGCARSRGFAPHTQCFYIKRMVGSNSPSAANGGCTPRMKKWACRSGRYHMVVSVQVKGMRMVKLLDSAVGAVPPITDAKVLREMVTCLISFSGAPA